MTDDLATALHAMADSEQPPAMDVERVLHAGRQSVLRRRMATLGGGTAALAATALVVGMLAPTHGLGHHKPAPAATTPAPGATRTPPAVVDPHDPVLTFYQFGYLPAGMHSYGGGTQTVMRNPYSGTVMAYADSGFQLLLSAQVQPESIGQKFVDGGVTEHVPATVPGASQAFWVGYGQGDLIRTDPENGDYAQLFWQLPSGVWLQITAYRLQTFPDWKEQTIKVAANVVRQDRSVPMPITVAGGAPQGFTLEDAWVTRENGETVGHLDYAVPSEPMVQIIAFPTGADALEQRVMTFKGTNVCKDANGLTVCVATTTTQIKQLLAIGGAQGLLDRVTPLGTDPANWTTDVIQSPQG